jgi:hypothetical protein
MKKILILIPLLILSVNCFSDFQDDFLDNTKYGWATREKYLNYRTDKTARQKLLQIYDLKKQKITDNMLKSAIAPGWGQMSAGQFTKGQIILGTELVIIGSYIYFYDQYKTQYDEYEKANYIVDIEDYYKKANEYHTASRAVLGIGIAVWIYNLYDTVITTNSYNQDLWTSLYQDYQRQKITLSPLGFNIRF